MAATRKLQKDIERSGAKFNSTVFLRKDIYDLLADQTPDRGKESVANLDWSDDKLLEEMLRKRFESNPDVDGDFRTIWAQFFEAHLGGEDSFRYILERSLFQPRAVLNFVTKCLQVAVGRDHSRVHEDDILSAEKAFSEDMLKNVFFEVRDIYPEFCDVLHSFIGYSKELGYDDIELIASNVGIKRDAMPELLDSLLWFSFLGVVAGENVRYSYDASYDLGKLGAFQRGIPKEKRRYHIHPAFHKALELE